MAITPDDDLTTIFGKVVDPTVLGMCINDLRILLLDSLEGCTDDNHRVDRLVMMLTNLTMGEGCRDE